MQIALDKLQSRVMFIDPAASKQKLKRTAANQAIVVVGSFDHWIFVLEAWRGRLATEKFHDKILDTVRIFSPRRVGCEANAMQILFANDIQLIARLKGVRLSIEPVYQPTKIEKPTRIRHGLQPIINFGRLVIDQKRMPGLIEEIVAHPHGGVCDLVDCLESACRMLPLRSPDKNKAGVENALKAYLEKVGTNPRVAEKRLESWRSQQGRQTLSNLLEPS